MKKLLLIILATLSINAIAQTNIDLSVNDKQVPKGQAISISRNGNVGIGIEYPDYKLDVNGDARLSGSLLLGNWQLNNNLWPGSGGFTFKGGDVTFGINSVAGQASLLIDGAFIQSEAGKTNTYAGISSFNNSVNFPGTGIWNTSGNVGIGTQTPTHKLDVNGDAQISGNLLLGNWQLNNSSWPGTGGFTYKGGDITFGLHSTTGQASLQINGAFIQSETGKTNTYAGASTFNNTVSFPGAGIWNTSGNVGIGTRNPQSPLHIKASTEYGSIRVSPSSDNAQSSIGFFADTNGTANSSAWIMGNSVWGNTGMFIIGNQTAGGPVIAAQSNGNVGIGVIKPTAVLHIKAGTSGTAPLKLSVGTNLTTPEAGAMEYDGSHLYFTSTNGGKRSQLDQQNNLLTSSQVANALGYTPLAGNQSITVSGDATGSGATAIALTLANSGATPGTYNNVTVDTKGRVVSGNNASYLTINNGNIEVAQTAKVGTLNCVGDAKIGGALNLTGDIEVGEKVSAKEVTTNILNVTGDAFANKYIVLKGTSNQFLKADGSLDNSQYLTGINSAMVASALGYTPLAGNQTVTVSGDATGSGATAIALTLANSGATPGTYNNVTVDTKGRVVAGNNASYLTINDGNIEVAQTAKVGTLNCVGDAKIGGALNLTGDIEVGEKVNAKEVSTNILNVTGNAFANKYIVLKGTSNQFLKADGSLDNSQYLTGINSTLVASALGYTPLAGNQTVTVSGDATGSGTTAISLNLANSGVAAGTYNNVTVDTKGRVLTGSNTNYLTGITTEQVQGALGYSPLAGNQTVTVSGDATGSGATAISLTLANSGVAAGTYNNVTVDTKGRVLTGSNTNYLTGITPEQVQGALGYTPYNSTNPSGYITLSNLSGYLPTTGGTITGSFLVQGNVGIGTANPDQRLTVKGKIHAEEVIIDLAVPADYVFKPDYKLMPLRLVEQFVKTNSHLPEIPSASEITKNGLSMGEMQNKLLQKVEELTLYLIEQQKHIDVQNEEIKQLKKIVYNK